jgi:hypothetical protein
MIAMSPVLERGLTFWDRFVLPRDEFEQRAARIQSELERRDLTALAIFERTYFSNGPMSYLAGLCVGGALLVRRVGLPVLLTVGNERELPHNKTLTWIDDLRADPGGRGAQIARALRKDGFERGTVATVGTDVLTSAGYTSW